MYFTTATSTTNLPITYLPMNTNFNYGGVTQWTTSSYDALNEHGVAVLEQITKVHTMMTKYAELINGVIFEELTERLSTLFFQVSCQWGYAYYGSTIQPPGTTTSISPSYWSTVPYTSGTWDTSVDPKYVWCTPVQTTTGTTTMPIYIGSAVYTY